MAFTNWLSAKTHKNINLPTLAQWQRAAQGDDGRKYPWGNDEDENRSHNRPRFKRKPDTDYTYYRDGVHRYDPTVPLTTPVTQYPNGASPFGVLDMCGNTGEWCMSLRSSDTQFSIIGPVADHSIRAICSNYWHTQITEVSDHYYAHASVRHMGWGFRVCAIPAT